MFYFKKNICTEKYSFINLLTYMFRIITNPLHFDITLNTF